jgi:outer membrane protein
MKEHTGRKDPEAKYKAQSEEKKEELDAEIKDPNKTPLIFKRKQTIRRAQQKELNYKREQQLSYAQQALSQQLQQESGTEMDISSGVKNPSKQR